MILGVVSKLVVPVLLGTFGVKRVLNGIFDLERKISTYNSQLVSLLAFADMQNGRKDKDDRALDILTTRKIISCAYATCQEADEDNVKK